MSFSVWPCGKSTVSYRSEKLWLMCEFSYPNELHLSHIPVFITLMLNSFYHYWAINLILYKLKITYRFSSHTGIEPRPFAREPRILTTVIERLIIYFSNGEIWISGFRMDVAVWQHTVVLQFCNCRITWISQCDSTLWAHSYETVTESVYWASYVLFKL